MRIETCAKRKGNSLPFLNYLCSQLLHVSLKDLRRKRVQVAPKQRVLNDEVLVLKSCFSRRALIITRLLFSFLGEEASVMGVVSVWAEKSSTLVCK